VQEKAWRNEKGGRKRNEVACPMPRENGVLRREGTTTGGENALNPQKRVKELTKKRGGGGDFELPKRVRSRQKALLLSRKARKRSCHPNEEKAHLQEKANVKKEK